jgi:hypothetical protein
MRTRVKVEIVLCVSILAFGTAAITSLPEPASDPDVTYMSCHEVVAHGFLPYTHHNACADDVGVLAPINTDCNNESFNLGGDSPEQTLTAKMFRTLCK